MNPDSIVASATDHFKNIMIPALKGRAKFIQSLRDETAPSEVRVFSA
jgi:hypothetical protein